MVSDAVTICLTSVTVYDKGIYLAHRGAFLETILKRSEERSPRAGFATPHPGGFGHRPTGTTTGPRGARCTGAGEGPPVCTR